MNKKAGFEMSMNTIVILVIAVAMLMLGIYFISRIRTTVSESLDVMDTQVKDQLTKAFASGEAGKTIAILQKTVKIKPGTKSFSVPVAFDSPTGRYTNLSYMVNVTSYGDCDVNEVKSWFTFPKVGSKETDFTWTEAANAYLNIILDVPSDAPKCNKMIRVTCFVDNIQKSYDSFTIEITGGGMFG